MIYEYPNNVEYDFAPKTLDEIVGQPQVYKLMMLVHRPRRSCWLLEGPPGTGKTASAHLVADALGCTIMSRHVVKASRLDIRTAEELIRTVSFVPMDKARFHVVILEEFEKCVSAEVRTFLKCALDQGTDPEDGGLPSRAIVIATSNDPTKIDPGLLERFTIVTYSGGPEFAECCQDRLAELWEKHTDEPMPYGWRQWGWKGNRFSMRVALMEMRESLEVKEIMRS